MKVLIVDDDVGAFSGITMALKSLEAIEVETLQFAEDALDVVKQNGERFDRYLIDVLLASTGRDLTFDSSATHGGLTVGLALVREFMQLGVCASQILLITAGSAPDLLNPTREFVERHDGLRLLYKQTFRSPVELAEVVLS